MIRSGPLPFWHRGASNPFSEFPQVNLESVPF
jgi:hypothetical protein